MSDMDYDSEEYDIEYSCDSDSEPDVNLENQYYNAKSLKVFYSQVFYLLNFVS